MGRRENSRGPFGGRLEGGPVKIPWRGGGGEGAERRRPGLWAPIRAEADMWNGWVDRDVVAMVLVLACSGLVLQRFASDRWQRRFGAIRWEGAAAEAEESEALIRGWEVDGPKRGEISPVAIHRIDCSSNNGCVCMPFGCPAASRTEVSGCVRRFTVSAGLLR